MKQKNGSRQRRRVTNKRKWTARYEGSGVGPNSIAKALRMRCVRALPFVDYAYSNNVTTTVDRQSPLDKILAGNGLLATFPQHATPIYQSGQAAFRLRSKLRLHFMELDLSVTGSEANAISPGDIHNSYRVAVYRTGVDYADTPIKYLVDPLSGATTQDVEHVYLDKRDVVVTKAIYPSSLYNVPDEKNYSWVVPLNLDLVCWSTNATGLAAQWDTQKSNIFIEMVSDSSVSPSPLMAYNARIFFDFVEGEPGL